MTAEIVPIGDARRRRLERATGRCQAGHIIVKPAGRFWDVVLITPAPTRSLRTSLARCSMREDAVDYAVKAAVRTGRVYRDDGDETPRPAA